MIDRYSGSVRMGSMGSWETINFEKGVLEPIDFKKLYAFEYN